MSGQLMYVRAKRERTTVFVECRSKDTVASVKATLAGIIGRDVHGLRLLGAAQQPLGEQSTLEEAQVPSTSVVYYVLRDNRGEWENVDIPAAENDAPDDEDDEDDEDEAEANNDAMAGAGAGAGGRNKAS